MRPRTEAAPPVNCTDLYGCNMACRMSAVGDASFDERLVLYGWMEDKDFSRTVGRKGRLVESGTMAGVHLGIKSGRTPGKKYGYSQVVNPWYLHKKGMLSAGEAGSKILRPVLMNAARSIRPEKHIDRRGRLGWELFVVDDASTDGTEREVRSYSDKRITYIRHRQNWRVSAARNTGIRCAQGEYVSFLDDDDEWLPEKLAKRSRSFAAPIPRSGLCTQARRSTTNTAESSRCVCPHCPAGCTMPCWTGTSSARPPA